MYYILKQMAKKFKNPISSHSTWLRLILPRLNLTDGITLFSSETGCWSRVELPGGPVSYLTFPILSGRVFMQGNVRFHEDVSPKHQPLTKLLVPFSANQGYIRNPKTFTHAIVEFCNLKSAMNLFNVNIIQSSCDQHGRLHEKTHSM